MIHEKLTINTSGLHERRTDCEMAKRFIYDEHVSGDIECVRVLRFEVVVCYNHCAIRY